MGIPLGYATELPKRCLRLIEELLPLASSVKVPGEEHLGPLTTTFLLALSTPIIVLPIERVERHHGDTEGYSDERFLNPGTAKVVSQALGGEQFRRAPFFRKGAWRFATVPYEQGMNVARVLPEQVALSLSDEAAGFAAERIPANQWASCLRNALAHGGIVYLDSEGRQTYGGETKMLAFVSAKYAKGSPTPEHLNFLRISEVDFLTFLQLWVSWLSSSGLDRALAA